MRLLNSLLDYSVFAKSDDRELIEFCNYFNSSGQWNENRLQSIMENINGDVIERLSLAHLLSTVHYMRHWIFLPSILEIITTLRSYNNLKVVDSKYGGAVIIDNFKKVDFSIDGRINTIISLLEEFL